MHSNILSNIDTHNFHLIGENIIYYCCWGPVEYFISYVKSIQIRMYPCENWNNRPQEYLQSSCDFNNDKIMKFQ